MDETSPDAVEAKRRAIERLSRSFPNHVSNTKPAVPQVPYDDDGDDDDDDDAYLAKPKKEGLAAQEEQIEQAALKPEVQKWIAIFNDLDEAEQKTGLAHREAIFAKGEALNKAALELGKVEFFASVTKSRVETIGNARKYMRVAKMTYFRHPDIRLHLPTTLRSLNDLAAKNWGATYDERKANVRKAIDNKLISPETEQAEVESIRKLIQPIEPDKPLLSFWSYFGGKKGAAHEYPAPQFNTIVECFAGAAGYSLHYHFNRELNCGRNVILVDIDPEIAAIWQYLINDATPEDVLKTKVDISRIDEIHANTPLGLKLLMSRYFNKGGTTLALTGWTKDLREEGKEAGWSPRVRYKVAKQVPAIGHWKIVHGDYRESESLITELSTLFVDPPYEVKGKSYKHSMTKEELAELGTWCLAMADNGHEVIACEQMADDGTMPDWLPFREWRTNHGFHGPFTELLWSNNKKIMEAEVEPESAGPPQLTFFIDGLKGDLKRAEEVYNRFKALSEEMGLDFDHQLEMWDELEALGRENPEELERLGRED